MAMVAWTLRQRQPKQMRAKTSKSVHSKRSDKKTYRRKGQNAKQKPCKKIIADNLANPKFTSWRHRSESAGAMAVW
jgi:hypothetical protein